MTELVDVLRRSIPADRVVTDPDVISTRAHGRRLLRLLHAAGEAVSALIIGVPGDEAARARAERAFDRIVDDAIALGGTVTGEHGVGLLKRRGLHAELSPALVALHHGVKRALDPAGIFNPGKVFGTP